MNEAYERGRSAAAFSRDCWHRSADQLKRKKIKVYGTKAGKLFIKPLDLFSQEKVRRLIEMIEQKRLSDKS